MLVCLKFVCRAIGLAYPCPCGNSRVHGRTGWRLDIPLSQAKEGELGLLKYSNT